MNSILRNTSIFRIALAIIGMAVVLCPVRLDPAYTLHPWLLGAIVFGFTLLLIETIQNRFSFGESSTWKMIGFSIGFMYFFGVVCLILMFAIGTIGREVSGEIGDKVINTMIRMYSLSVDFGYVYGVAYLIDALFSRRRKQNKAALTASDLSQRANSHLEPEAGVVLQNIVKVVVVGSGMWIFGAASLALGILGPDILELFELFQATYNDNLPIWICLAVSAVVTLIALKLFCPAASHWSSSRLSKPILLITIGHICSILAYALAKASMVDGVLLSEPYFLSSVFFSMLVLLLHCCGVISAFAVFNDPKRAAEG